MSAPPVPLLVANGTLVNDDRQWVADLLIHSGRIVAIGAVGSLQAQADAAGARVIDATDCFVVPGGIDPHTHLQLPFMGTVSVDDFDVGTQAAVAGGTTCIIDFVIPGKTQSLLEAYDQWRGWADPKVNCDYGLHVAITNWNAKVAQEMGELCRERGVSSYKFFMAYKGSFMVNDEQMFHGFQRCKDLGALALVHAENGDLVAEGQKHVLMCGVHGPEGHELSRPEEVEAEATNRAVTIANRVNTPVYIVHVMSKGAADVVVRARREGNRCFGEPIAAGLAVDGTKAFDKDWRVAAAYVMSPPLRSDVSTKEYLLRLLAAGDLACVGTDNCTFSADQKAMGKDDFSKIPNGVNGIEDRMPIVWTRGVATGILTPSEFVRATSTMAAKLFNMYPQKGRLDVGSDADVVIINPKAKRTISAKTHHHKVDFNIFEGMEVTGIPVVTISRGVVVWENGKLTTTPGSGKFVPRPCFGFAFEGIATRDEVNNVALRRVERDPYMGPVLQLN